jgi:predicted TIM-barrel fold metal-dependent hydrolase
MLARGRIDTHMHVVPPDYRAWLLSKGLKSGGKPIPEWSAAAALELMQTNGIETSILSVSTPGVEPAAANPAEAATRARELNQFCAELMGRFPARFGFFATLPLPNINAAISEVAHSLDELRADGVILLSNTKGVYLGDDSLLPLMSELDQRGAVVFVHPSELGAEPVPSIPAHAIDFLLDTTRAALNMARHSWPERFPNTKILLAHGGGFVPYAAQRMAVNASADADERRGLEMLRRFWFDTALTSSNYALPSLLSFADPERVTFGSDFPFAPAERSTSFTRRLDHYEGHIDRAAINRGNAERLFPRLTGAADNITSEQTV